MDLNNVIVADIEADGLLDTITKIHVMSYSTINEKTGKWKVESTPSYKIIKKAFSNSNVTFVIHNGRRYDKQAIEKVLGIEVKATIIDSLSLAWVLYPARVKNFGLAEFGEEYGVPKPKVEDWVGLSYEEYKHRCEEDVKINTLLWVDLLKKGRQIYGSDEKLIRLINMTNFIMDCSAKQEEQKVKVDVKKTLANLEYFESLKEEKLETLKQAMPKDIKKGIIKAPKVLLKKDGSYSAAGEKWIAKLEGLGLPLDTLEYEGIISEKEPNPNSPQQKKDWLYSLGWKPETFEYKRDKATGKTTKIEQIASKETKELCKSVKKLVDKEPAIEALDMLSVLTHRIGILKGFLKAMDEDHMISQGLTRLAVTFRWQHATIVNIPRVTGKGDIRDGKWLRECLISKDNKRIVQADLSGVESRTSDHYTFNLNPERITKTQQPFFDPHTEISVVADLMTAEEESFYVFNSAIKDLQSAGEKWEHLDYKNFSIYPYNEEVQKLHDLSDSEKKSKMQTIKNARSKGKTTNYSSLYLVGAKTLSRTLEISTEQAQDLIDAYWDVHWAVKAVTETFKTRKIGEETWIYNPVSKFWYYLRNDKDKFSVVNQSTAVYVFNMWVYFISKRIGFPITQTHDDIALDCEDNEESVDKMMEQIKLAMEDVNDHIKLNVRLDCEVQNGYNFAETH